MGNDGVEAVMKAAKAEAANLAVPQLTEARWLRVSQRDLRCAGRRYKPARRGAIPWQQGSPASRRAFLAHGRGASVAYPWASPHADKYG